MVASLVAIGEALQPWLASRRYLNLCGWPRPDLLIPATPLRDQEGGSLAGRPRDNRLNRGARPRPTSESSSPGAPASEATRRRQQWAGLAAAASAPPLLTTHAGAEPTALPAIESGPPRHRVPGRRTRSAHEGSAPVPRFGTASPTWRRRSPSHAHLWAQRQRAPSRTRWGFPSASGRRRAPNEGCEPPGRACGFSLRVRLASNPRGAWDLSMARITRVRAGRSRLRRRGTCAPRRRFAAQGAERPGASAPAAKAAGDRPPPSLPRAGCPGRRAAQGLDAPVMAEHRATHPVKCRLACFVGPIASHGPPPRPYQGVETQAHDRHLQAGGRHICCGRRPAAPPGAGTPRGQWGRPIQEEVGW